MDLLGDYTLCKHPAVKGDRKGEKSRVQSKIRKLALEKNPTCFGLITYEAKRRPEIKSSKAQYVINVVRYSLAFSGCIHNLHFIKNKIYTSTP